MARHPKAQNRKRAEGELRQSQLVTTFGPGAMMDLLDQAVLIGGLDFWRYERGRGVDIQEPRLRDLLVERFRGAGIELSHQAFRKAPVGDDDCTTPEVGVPVLEFPTWFVCQNVECRALVGKRGLELKKGRRWHRCDKGDSPSVTVPVRFLGACRRGHLQDFPWLYFVHELQGKSRCPMPQLRLIEDATGDFSGISLVCRCGEKAQLSTALGGARPTCEGKRPWLGGDAQEECGDNLRLLVRTASNSYFAQVVSALSIPEPGKEIEEAVQEHWDMLKVATAETLPAFLTVPKVKATLGAYKLSDILAAIGRLHRGAAAPRLPLRTAEFMQLVNAKPENPGELPRRTDAFFAREHERLRKPAGVAKVVLAAKLREVRVQIGFTRLEPVSADLQGEFDLGVESAHLGLATEWLPATEVQGEGVLLQLDEASVRAWEDREAVLKRSKELELGHAAACERNPGLGQFPGIRFYMLHSLSHLLITAISLECGYSASAIRERIYCGPSRTDPTPMAAILLSTGTSGSEGTLGGLVDQGRYLVEHLRRAFDLGRLCSNDPICASHSPANDPAERHLEGAACHGCLFISEPSCERYNRFLDRALIVPCLEHDAKLAFFSERP
jgi:hypothetical protein